MQQHLTPQQIDDMAARRVDPLEMVTLSRHLSECEQCQSALCKPARTAQRVSQLRRNLAAEDIAPAHWSFFDWLNQFRPMRMAIVGGALVVLIAVGWWVKPVTPTPPDPQIVGNHTPLPVPSPNENSSQSGPLLELNDNGRRITLDQTGNLTGLAELPEDLSSAINRSLVAQKLETPESELKTLRSHSATLMGDNENKQAIKLTSPVGIVLATDRPTFRWQTLPGAQSYAVTVLDADFNIVETSQPLTQLTQGIWQVPRSLARGQIYSWQVTAVIGDKTIKSSSASAAEARFKIITAEQSRQLNALGKQSAQSHLAMGTLYARFGLMEESAREFQALLKSNPQSTVAQKLLTQARSLAAR